jgi:nucleoside-triphosphatase
MDLKLKIDRAIYGVDDATRTYRYLRRNSGWQQLDPEENERNKQRLNGYTRILRDGRRKMFTYRPSNTDPRKPALSGISTSPTVPRILITGAPGSGKSTLMAELIQDVHARRIAGLSTPEVRRGANRVGFKLIDLASGKEEILASTSGKGPAVGKYHVNVAGIDEIVRRVEASLDSADFIFIDEIGKMEFLSRKFEVFIEHVFSLNKPIVAVVHRNFVTRYRDKGQVFALTRENFERVRNSILAEIKATAGNCA